MRHPERMTTRAIPIVADPAVVVDVGEPPEFALELDVFEGPLQLLLELIESRQLDVLTVPLADVADAYLAYLAQHPVEPAQLAQFIGVASQLILIKSRSLLPSEPTLASEASPEESEDELRQRLLAYRAYRDAALGLGGLDLASPAWRREPRESDLPLVPPPIVAAATLASALDGLVSLSLPPLEPPVVIAREVTIGQQIAALRDALGAEGRVVLQAVLGSARSRTEVVVTLLAALELVRRREVTAAQDTLFGPIVLESAGGAR